MTSHTSAKKSFLRFTLILFTLTPLDQSDNPDPCIFLFLDISLSLDSAENVGLYTSLTVVNNYPAISYYDYTNGNLKFITANSSVNISVWKGSTEINNASGQCKFQHNHSGHSAY